MVKATAKAIVVMTMATIILVAKVMAKAKAKAKAVVNPETTTGALMMGRLSLKIGEAEYVTCQRHISLTITLSSAKGAR